MNYETAKKLKDAGFPQEIGDDVSRNCYFSDDDQKTYLAWHPNAKLYGNSCKCPTLSELIEACGYSVNLSNLIGYREKYETTDDWIATKHYGFKRPEDIGTGKTPEEAVANLWLALNNKEYAD